MPTISVHICVCLCMQMGLSSILSWCYSRSVSSYRSVRGHVTQCQRWPHQMPARCKLRLNYMEVGIKVEQRYWDKGTCVCTWRKAHASCLSTDKQIRFWPDFWLHDMKIDYLKWHLNLLWFIQKYIFLPPHSSLDTHANTNNDLKKASNHDQILLSFDWSFLVRPSLWVLANCGSSSFQMKNGKQSL